MAACRVSLGLREAEYMEWVARMGGKPGVAGSSTPELLACVEAFGLFLEEQERQPCRDLLGPAWMELNSGGSAAQWNGEFYTPQEVSYFMAKMMFANAEIPEDRPITLGEPACGSAGMVLSTVEVLAEQKIAPNRVWVEARDVSRLACDMAYTNLTLCGVPAVVIHGNTLSMQEYGRWRTPWRTAFERSPIDEVALEAMRMVEAIIGGKEHSDEQERARAAASGADTERKDDPVEERNEGQDPPRQDREGPQGEGAAERPVRDGEDAGRRDGRTVQGGQAGSAGPDRGMTLF